MRFRVTFKERTNAGGQPSESPSDALEAQAPEGVILDKSFLSRDEPAGLRNEETIEEDDGFLSIVPETCEYAIADGRGISGRRHGFRSGSGLCTARRIQ